MDGGARGVHERAGQVAHTGGHMGHTACDDIMPATAPTVRAAARGAVGVAEEWGRVGVVTVEAVQRKGTN